VKGLTRTGNQPKKAHRIIPQPKMNKNGRENERGAGKNTHRTWQGNSFGEVPGKNHDAGAPKDQFRVRYGPAAGKKSAFYGGFMFFVVFCVRFSRGVVDVGAAQALADS